MQASRIFLLICTIVNGIIAIGAVASALITISKVALDMLTLRTQTTTSFHY
jgi:hypothetical protein